MQQRTKMMMKHDYNSWLQERTGGAFGGHGRFASRTGWIGAARSAVEVRRLAAIIAGLPGISVPSGRRLRT